MINAELKAKTVAEYKQSANDTGSPEVQIALITERIKSLTEHFKTNKHDNHSRQGLLKLVSLRNRLLKYLRCKDAERFRTLIKRLELRDKWSAQ